MKRLFATALLATALVAFPAAAQALEAGVTFNDGGTCTEADGTAGLSQADGECITPADYDALFGFENLDATESLTTPGVSIAEEAGIVDDGQPASERKLGEGLVETPTSFKTKVGLQFAEGEWFYVGNGFVIS